MEKVSLVGHKLQNNCCKGLKLLRYELKISSRGTERTLSKRREDTKVMFKILFAECCSLRSLIADNENNLLQTQFRSERINRLNIYWLGIDHFQFVPIIYIGRTLIYFALSFSFLIFQNSVLSLDHLGTL